MGFGEGLPFIITLVAAALECASLVWLVLRNRYFDRANALLHSPLVAQEVAQVLLWFVVEPSTGERTCGPPNRVLSMAVAGGVYGFPGWACVVCHLQRLILFPLPFGFGFPHWLGVARRWLGLRGPWTDEWPRRRLSTQLDGIRAGATVWSFLLGAGMVAYTIARNLGFGDPAHARPPEEAGSFGDWVNWYFSGPACTTLGPHGLLVSPMMVYSHWAFKFILGMLYFTLYGNFNLLGRPSFAFALMSACGFPVAAVSAMALGGDEWTAAWTAVVSALPIVAYLAEPMLIDKLHVLDPEFLQPTLEAQELRSAAGVGFSLAWRQCPYELIPWQALLEEEAAKEEPPEDGDDGFVVHAGFDVHKAFGPPESSCAAPPPMEMGRMAM